MCVSTYSAIKVRYFSHIDPLGRPTVTAVSDHCFRMCCLHFSESTKTKQIQAKTMFANGETVGLAKWIIDDKCLVLFATQVVMVNDQGTNPFAYF